MIYAKDFAKNYDKIYKEKYYKDYSDFIKRIIKKRGLKNPTIFDIGCGTGRLIKYFKNWDCFGIEPSIDMARIAKKRNKNANILIGKFNIKIKGKFDVIISTFDTINYIIKNKEIENLLKNIKNHIKDGGFFIFDFNTDKKNIPMVIKKNGFTYYSTVKDKYWKIKIVSDNGYTETHKERFYNFKKMETMIKNVGMKIMGIYSDRFSKIIEPNKEQRLIMVVEKMGSKK